MWLPSDCLGAAPRAVAGAEGHRGPPRATALVLSAKVPDLIQGAAQTQPRCGRSALGVASRQLRLPCRSFDQVTNPAVHAPFIQMCAEGRLALGGEMQTRDLASEFDELAA